MPVDGVDRVNLCLIPLRSFVKGQVCRKPTSLVKSNQKQKNNRNIVPKT